MDYRVYLTPAQIKKSKQLNAIVDARIRLMKPAGCTPVYKNIITACAERSSSATDKIEFGK